ncbi:serine hydrolase domain-containing protein [Winogradskyella psychrotolerans]|uniref:serine hydrolase domain-containing protein n=1 Tax=Winogradskyella psychrotolerans TaxID=1344585 RepID=UPI001C075B3A|nr:serine hydrolase domain-containing protein [Winogradskyella psychrotolerans]MBU2929634.1 beta-lactamase family protein [Winogradskyella psychrotolerans]
MKLNYKVLLVCTHILFFISNLKAQNNLIYSFDVNKISEKIDSLLMDYNSKEAGMSIGIVINNKLVIQKQLGLANLEHQIPITRETSFHVASVSKQFTAFAILQLENEGKLSLNDEIRKYVPELNEFENKITINNLLNHTSGIKDQWNLLRLSGWRLNDFIDNDHVLNILYNQTSLNFEPNKDFMYSNSGYTLLAEIITRVSGMQFSEYTEKYIFKPLKMDNTQFVDKEGQIIKNKANSYYKDDEYYIQDVFNNASYGATNLSTTIEDLSKWIINFNKKEVGDSSLFDKMHSQEKLSNGNTYGYANGQFINKYKGIRRISHSGQDASYQAYIGRFPDLDISIIFFNNSSEIDGGKVVGQLTEICLSDYLENKNYEPKSETLLSKKAPIIKPVKSLKNYEGYYWNGKDRYSRQLKIQNDTLQYIRNDDDKTALIPVDNNEFEMAIDEYVSVSFQSNQMVLTLNDGYQITLDKYIPADYNSNSLKQFEGKYYSSELNTFYTLSVEDNILVANHTRLGNFKLKAIKNDFFIGNKGSIQKVVFLRNELGKIVGLNISSSRAKNIKFNKLSE